MAVRFMRQNMVQKISMADLAAYCGVAERTLRKHFHEFMAVPAFDYWRRLRLAAAREHLQKATNSTSITMVAARFGFDHFGRFSQQYRRCFGETPSATLRRSRVAELSRTSRIRDDAARDARAFVAAASLPRNKPSIAIMPFQVGAAESEHRFFGECLAEGIGTALARVRSLSVVFPRPWRSIWPYDLRRLFREAQYSLIGSILQTDKRIRIIVRLLATTTGAQI
jgi:TolB-like protein